MVMIQKNDRSVGRNVEKPEPSYITLGIQNNGATLEKQSGSSSECETELPYYPEIPLLDIYPRQMKTYVHTKTCT